MYIDDIMDKMNDVFWCTTAIPNENVKILNRQTAPEGLLFIFHWNVILKKKTAGH